MSIYKVEYQAESLKPGFAEAGDKVSIESENADTINDDVEADKTKPLNKGQQLFLNHYVDGSGDDTDYDTGEDGLDDESYTGESGNETGATAGTLLGTAALGAGMGVATQAASQLAESMLFGELAEESSSAYVPNMNAFTAVAIGAADLALAGFSLSTAMTFDSGFSQRRSYYSEADADISSLNAQLEILNADIEKMNAVLSEDEEETTEETTESEAAEDTGEAQEVDIETLVAQLEQCLADGDEEGANEIREQIAKYLESGGESDNEDPAAEFTGNNINAQNLNSHCTNVGSFLRDGNELGGLGVINTVALGASSVLSTGLAAAAYVLANPFNAAAATAGAAMCMTAAGIFSAAAVVMGVRTVQEFECGSKGGAVFGALSSFRGPLEEHEQLISEIQSKGEEDGEESIDEAAEISAEVTEITSSMGGGTLGASISLAGGSSLSSGGASSGGAGGGFSSGSSGRSSSNP